MSLEVNRSPEELLRLRDVLRLVPVSKTTWWLGCRTGRFPRPVHIGRMAFWTYGSITELLASIKGSRT